jgi:TPP-dependent 2-oxoacid decarboxylase
VLPNAQAGYHREANCSRWLWRLSRAQAILTPENCVAEFERVLAAMLYHQRPGVLALHMRNIRI